MLEKLNLELKTTTMRVTSQADNALIVVGKREEGDATLEINVHEEKTGSIFVHHNIRLFIFES